MENNKIDGGINFHNNLNTQNNENKNTELIKENVRESNHVENTVNTETKTIEEVNQSIDSNKIESLKNSAQNEIKEEVKPTTTTNTKQSYTDEQKSHMTQADLDLEKKIEEILNDDLSKIYESLNEIDKKKFEQDKYEASINIIVALKAVGGNIKKAIKNIFNIVYRLISSLKNINNRAFIEKITKIKVERIIRTQENDINK